MGHLPLDKEEEEEDRDCQMEDNNKGTPSYLEAKKLDY